MLGISIGGSRSLALEVPVLAALRVSYEPRLGSSWNLAGVMSGGFAPHVWEHLAQVRFGWQLVFGTEALRGMAGLEAGPAVLAQVAASDSASALGGALSPRLGARLALGSRFSATLEAELSFLLIRVDGRLRTLMLPWAGAGLAYSL
jgi:hypothetical protein